MNRLVLINQTGNMYFPHECSCCRLMELYYNNSYKNRVVRKIILSLGLPGKRFVLNRWTEQVSDSDEIILFDTGNASGIIRWLKRRWPGKRIILWYWNPSGKTIPVEKTIKLGVEIWSFDPADCEKYGLKYNTQFFISENRIEPVMDLEGTADVFFVGTDKNRSEMLGKLKSIFDAHGISSYFHLVKYDGADESGAIKYRAPMKYREVLKNVAASKAVIDLVSEGQTGLTLRPLEAYLYKKKLITNMRNIVSYRIYDPENVFILGVDDIEKLPEFIASPFKTADYSTLAEFYMMDEWLERFEGNGGFCDFMPKGLAIL